MRVKTQGTRRKTPGKSVVISRRKIEIIGILMMVGALLVVLAIISYSRSDETAAGIPFGKFLLLFGGDQEVQALADTTSNWLGLFGAMMAHFFIHSTVGFFSLVIPILIGLWGWFIFQNKDQRVLAYYTNYVLLIVVLSATFVGLLRTISWFPQLPVELSGAIGDYTAGLLTRFIGVIGGFIIIVTALLVVIILMIDLDLKKSLDRLRMGLKASIGWIQARIGRGKSAMKSSSGDRFDTSETGLDASRKSSERVTSAAEDLKIRTATPLEEILEQRERPSRPRDKTVSELDRASDVQAPEKRALVGDDGNSGEVTGDSPANDGSVDEAIKDISQINASLSRHRFQYVPPSYDLLDLPVEVDTVSKEELKAKAKLVEDKLRVFDIGITDITVTPGPVVTLYELVPDSSVKISKIVNLADDLALALAARGIRIIAPIPGKSAVGIEIPNTKPSLVGFRTVVRSSHFLDSGHALALGLGKTISGEVMVDDLAKMPHLLVAGATGSGKSVGINTMINSLLFRMHPRSVKFVMIDPKKIELAQYAPLRNHFLAICPDVKEDIITDPENAKIVLKSLEMEMEQRYDKLAKAGVRHLVDYNAKVKSGSLKSTNDVSHYLLPYIVVIIDELADLMITAAREVEEPIARIAQLARAVGIHLIVATQRPSVDVITGVIKANFPSRIAYQVASKVDSRTILDTNGAEQLLGNGDMLYQPSARPKPVRIQNAFISTAEVERVVDFVASQPGFPQPYLLPSVNVQSSHNGFQATGARDKLFNDAAKLVVHYQQGSVSLIQRRLRIGYTRAARIVDELEACGILGPYEGSKAREVLVDDEETLEQILQQK
ncbi:MAG: DNA translocase FtsK [Chlorobi bacterium]|nr:DNA translocase FtsK [Chlorobiota bacterium]